MFVNRESELVILAALVDRARNGSGGIMVVRGRQGIGKSSLLQAFTDAPRRAGTDIWQVSCHAQVGHFQSYGPFLSLLAFIEDTKPRSRLRRFAGQAARSAAPELLNLVPGVGSLLKSAAEAVAGAVPGAPIVDPSAAAHLVTQAVLDAVRRSRTAVVVIDDLHNIDASSCAVLSFLADAVADLPVLLVLVIRDDHDNRIITDLLDELHVRDRLRTLDLGGLEPPAVADYGRRVTGLALTDQQARELAKQTSGHPLTLRYFLAEAADTRQLTASSATTVSTPAGADAGGAVRDQLATFIRMRLARLDDDDRRLLSIGAVQGERFLSEVVAAVAGMDSDGADTRLHRLAQRTGLIIAEQPVSIATNITSDGYRFEHGLLQQALYQDQSDGQRRRRHHQIAVRLIALTEEPGPPPLELLLEITRHSRAGGDFLAAGRGAHGAACHLAGTGASVREVAAVCLQGITDLYHARHDQEVNRLRAQLLELLLAATELDWTADRGPDGSNPIEQTALDAIAAADACDDANLQVRVRYLYGKVLLYTQGLHQALGPLKAAWQAATVSGDAVSVLLAGCEYGRQLPKVDVTAGLDVLNTAARVADTDPAILTSTDPVVTRARDMLGLQIGVNLMDAGQLGPAVTRLRDAVIAIRHRGTIGLLPIGLNYLAQAELATAEPDRAQDALQEAVTLPGDQQGRAWDAVNLAYLGWLNVVYRDDPAGFALLEKAHIRSAKLWQANLAPLIATLHVTALLTAELDESTARTAQRILEETITETRKTGMLRSEVVALSLMGQLKLATGHPKDALAPSQAAIEHLRQANWALAAVTTEEILAHHAIILRENGDTAAAKNIIRRAAAEVRRKAQSLPHEQRAQFLVSVPVNRLVADTMASLSRPSA